MLSFEQKSALHDARIGAWGKLSRYRWIDLAALFGGRDARIALEVVWLVTFRTAVEAGVIPTARQIRSCQRVLQMIATSGVPVPVLALDAAEVVCYAAVAEAIDAAVRGDPISDAVRTIQSMAHSTHTPITLDLNDPLIVAGCAIGMDMALHDAATGVQRTDADAEESAWTDDVDGWFHAWPGEEADVIAAVLAGWRGQRIVPRV